MFIGPLLSDLVVSDALTVSEYASRLGFALRQVGPATLEGEVQNVKVTPRGMLFFQLTDGDSTLSCKVFPREVARLEHRPANGDLVRVQVDRPDFYAVSGSLNLIASQVSLAGVGELLRRRQELVARLTAEGLCDPGRRRPLPSFPHVVGVIAGEGSHGMTDVVKALIDRWPPVRVITHPSLVQGQAAPRQLIDALATFQERALVDVIVMARGGGSVQDLVCFDDEGLCRALFACEIPVVCAIGHTENNPVCNHVTWSAYTPSRSAEMVVPSAAEVRQSVARASELVNSVPGRLAATDERLGALASRLNIGTALDSRESQVRQLSADVSGALGEFLHAHMTGLAAARGTLAGTPRRAALELSTEQATLTAVKATLARTSERLSLLNRQVTDLGARVRDGISRQLETHTYDYSRAIARFMSETLLGLDRREARQRELIARETQLLSDGADSRLGAAKRDVMHLAEVIAARDFRRRGWLLASKDGAPVRSAAELRSGDRLDLQLNDGSASAVVEQVQSQHIGGTTDD